MKLHVQKVIGRPVVLIRARAENRDMVGDLMHYVAEGEEYAGYTYDELVTLAATKGTINVKVKGEK